MATNRPPRFTSSILVRTTEDDPLSRERSGDLLSFATDRDPGDTVTLVAVEGLGAGPIQGRFGTLEWDPESAAFTYTRDDSLRAVQALGAGETARERFQITASDAAGATANGVLIVELAGVNDAPAARNKSHRLVEDGGTTVVLGNLLLGVTDADRNDTPGVVAVNGGTATTVAGTYGTLTWHPLDGDYDYVLANGGAAVQGLGAGERGTDVFTFTVADGKGGEDTATLRVNVIGVNDAPTAPDLGIVAELGPVPVNLVGGGASDADGDTLSVLAVQGNGTPGSAVRGTYGTLTWDASGSGIYAPDAGGAAVGALGAGQAGVDRFGVTLADGRGGFATRDVTFTVLGVNDPARIEGSALSTVVEDVVPAAFGRLVAIDPDAGEAAFAAPASLAGTYGSFAFSAATGDWSYVLDNGRAAVQALAAGQVVADTLTVASLDGTASATLSVLVVGTSALPVAAPDHYAVAEDSLFVAPEVLGLLANDTGGDGARSVAPGSFVSARGGAVMIDAQGAFTYQPAANVFGTDSFTYTLADLDGDRVTSTVTLTITPVVDPIPAVDLDDVALGLGGFKILGEADGDGAGRSVSGAGDVNGDGFADLLVGAYRNDSDGSPNNGAAYVVFGKAGPATVDLDGIALGQGGFKILGEGFYDSAGVSVSGAGDVNGDGFADLIVGADGAEGGGREYNGAAYVVFGKAGGATIDLDDVALGQGGFKIFGEVDGDLAGSSVSGAGDVNGDGFADLIVGAYRNDGDGGANNGAAYVVFGKAGGGAVDLAGVALGQGGFKILGEANGDEAGRSVSGAGDVNGDGFADLIVGGDRNDSGSFNNGAAYVVFGRAGGAAVDLDEVALGQGGFKIIGELDSLFAGRSVSGAGDVNGDGFADLIVSTTSDYGAAYVVFGKDGGAAVDLDEVALGQGGYKILGEASFDPSSWSVSAAGDVNGDGHADLLVGADRKDSDGSVDNGAAYLVFGKTDGAAVELDDVALGLGGFKVLGEASNDLAGASVSAAGDVNKDGFADLLVGAPNNDSDGSVDNGAAYVLYGRASWAVDTPIV